MLYPVLLVSFPLILLIFLQRTVSIYIIFSTINIIVNYLLRNIIQSPIPLSTRDEKILTMSTNKGDEYKSNIYGMPSLIAQIAGFSIAFLFGINSKFRGILLTYLAIAMYAIYTQYSSKLNTIFQLFIGFILGVCGGGFVNYFFVKNKPNLDKSSSLEKDDKCFV